MISETERYIYNILDQVHKRDELEQIIYDLSTLGDFFNYKTINEIFGDDIESKKQAIISKLEKVESDILRSFLVNLVESDNLFLFDPGQFKSFVAEFETIAKKINFVTLTSAVDLKIDDVHELSERLSKKMLSWVKVDTVVDNSILGGAIIKNDNYILDFSLETRLSNFAAEWKKSLLDVKETNV